MRITCGIYTWKVHKAIVCVGSEFIRTALKFPVGKVSGLLNIRLSQSYYEQEAEDQCINFPDEDPEMIRRMIVFMYTSDYDPTSFAKCKDLRFVKLACVDRTADGVSKYFTGPPHVSKCACLTPTKLEDNNNTQFSYGPIHDCTNPLCVHALMFSLGDKYGVVGLCKAAVDKFHYSLFGGHHTGTEDFIDAVQIVYTTTPGTRRELRDEIVQCFNREYYVPLEHHPEIEDNLAEFNTVSMKLLEALGSARLVQKLLEE